MTVEMVMHHGSDNPVIKETASVKDALFVMTKWGLVRYLLWMESLS